MSRPSRLDWLLLLMTVIWGTNYALIKTAFREIDPQAFNALRLVLASCVMAGASLAVRRRRLGSGLVAQLSFPKPKAQSLEPKACKMDPP